MLDNGDALLAGLIVMEPLNKQKQRNFDRFMAAAGDLRVGRKLYPKMQLLSNQGNPGGQAVRDSRCSGQEDHCAAST